MQPWTCNFLLKTEGSVCPFCFSHHHQQQKAWSRYSTNSTNTTKNVNFQPFRTIISARWVLYGGGLGKSIASTGISLCSCLCARYPTYLSLFFCLSPALARKTPPTLTPGINAQTLLADYPWCSLAWRFIKDVSRSKNRYWKNCLEYMAMDVFPKGSFLMSLTCGGWLVGFLEIKHTVVSLPWHFAYSFTTDF